MAANFDREEILRTWGTFRQPCEVLELRIPKAGRYKTISGYFDDAEKLADAMVGQADEPFAGVYFTINPVKTDLLARASNRYVKYAETTTTDKDIIALHWLPIDLDAKRPAGISSTDKEHDAAISKSREIRSWLIEEQGWPAGAFILADSGNGSHLAIRIDLPNEPGNVGLIKGCLNALDYKFSDDVVHVDVTTFNPARIWKLYGTLARKGDSTSGRPHRLSKILEVPGPGETAAMVTREMLEALAQLAPTTIQTHAHGEDAHTHRPEFDVVTYVEAHGANVKKTSQKGDWSVYELEECPFDHSHSRGEAFISIHSGGARAFKCHHDSCKGRDWRALQELWEPERRENMGVDIPNNDTGRPGLVENAVTTTVTSASEPTSPSLPEMSIGDVCETKIIHEGRDDERIEYSFSPERACDAILQRFRIVSTNDKAIWVYHDGYYSPDGWDDILVMIHAVAGDYFNRHQHAELDEKIYYATRTKEDPFNKNPYLLCCKNKTINLLTGEVRDHDPADFLTHQIPVVFDPEAKCPRCVLFLEEVCPNITDRITLIDWIAVHAIKKSFPYVMFLLGRGRNEKGVYEDLLQRFYGEENFSNMDLEETKVKNNHFAKESLKNKIGLIISEAGEESHKSKKKIQTGFLKLASGDGVIDTDVKGKARIRFRPTFKATLDCNDMPEIEDTSKGWEERFLKADMPYYYIDNPNPDNLRERQKNPNLLAELTTDEELSGLLNLVVERAKEIALMGTITKRSGEDLVKEYSAQSHSVNTFLDTFCEYVPPRVEGGKLVFVSNPAPLKDVYRAYCEWCDSGSPKDMVDDKRFGASVKRFCERQMPKRDWDLDTGKRVRWYPGFTFQADLCQEAIEGKSVSVPLRPLETIKRPLESVSVPLGPLNIEKWNHIKNVYSIMKNHDRYDTHISLEEKLEKRPFNGPNGTASENSWTIKSDDGNASDLNGPEPKHSDIDSLPVVGGPTLGKIDRPTPERTPRRLSVAPGPDRARISG